MKKLPKILMPLAAALLVLPLLGGCAPQAPKSTGKLQIVATLFPQYDFARQLTGELADVTLLLPPGLESHSFEPTPADIIRINEADLFLYTGPAMEPWAQAIIDGLTGDVTVIDVSAGIALEEEGHHEEEGWLPHREEHGGVDPHVWTSPVNAKAITQNILDALLRADPQNAEAYRENAGQYQSRLDELDKLLQETVSQAEHREIVFGGRFAMRYFAERYGLSWMAAFDSCSGETEPSLGAVREIIDEIRDKNLPVIYYEELADPKMSRAIAKETGVKILLLHSCHNVSKQEFQEGATYISLMEQNAANLKEGLS